MHANNESTSYICELHFFSDGVWLHYIITYQQQVFLHPKERITKVNCGHVNFTNNIIVYYTFLANAFGGNFLTRSVSRLSTLLLCKSDGSSFWLCGFFVALSSVDLSLGNSQWWPLVGSY